MAAPMPDPIYETTASNRGTITTEHHSPGVLSGVPDNTHAGLTATYIEIPAEGPKGPNVPEFPSASAGAGTNDN